VVKGRSFEEQKIIEKVYANDQGHLLHFWGQLNSDEKDRLMNDLGRIDFDVLAKARKMISGSHENKRKASLPRVITLPRTAQQREAEMRAREKGEECISSSKVAVFTAAGGQSSRLGLDIPKGAYPVTPVRGKSLFQVHAEKILSLETKYAASIPWLIMVSETNRNQTVDFFRSNGYFGLNKDRVHFIEQGMYPAFDDEGRVLLKEKMSIFLSPSGHGGTFSALKESGTLEMLKDGNIEEIFYFQVDNVLIHIADPVFIGYHVLNRCDMSAKSVRKRNRGEKIGVFALEDGKTTVVEYSELSSIDSDCADVTPESFVHGSIAIHMINVDFALRLTEHGMNLPLHLAHKAISHIDLKGNRVDPGGPNGYKIETFIFDAMKQASESIVMEVKRDEEFSPLKNKSGEDSPETVHNDQLLFFARWFKNAGITVPCTKTGLPACRLEVSPLFAHSEEDFVEKIDRNMSINGDTYIG
jgi:UDP-N-acetylglucosamine/UDP-N-acetylgalactosamine diphosphorylase